MDDIWGAYALQAVFPNSVRYHRPTVYHARNEQDLVANLEDELLGYRQTGNFIEAGSGFNSLLPEKTQEFWRHYRAAYTDEFLKESYQIGTRRPGTLMTGATLIVVLCETRGHEKRFHASSRTFWTSLKPTLHFALLKTSVKTMEIHSTIMLVTSGLAPSMKIGATDLSNSCRDLHPRWRECAVIGPQWMGGIKSEPNHPGSGDISSYFPCVRCCSDTDCWISMIASSSPALISCLMFLTLLRSSSTIGSYGYQMENITVAIQTGISFAHLAKFLSFLAADLFKANPDEIINRMKSRDWKRRASAQGPFREGWSGQMDPHDAIHHVLYPRGRWAYVMEQRSI